MGGSTMFDRIDGDLVHSVAFGRGPGTLVAISGSIGSWEIWQQPIEILSERWCAIGLDHGGVGQTRMPAERIAFEQRVDTVIGVLDARGVERCVLAGDSSNVAAALAVALKVPERIAGLVLVSGAAWNFDRPETRGFVAAMRADFERTLASFARLCLPEDGDGHLKAWLVDIIRRTGRDACCRLIESYYEVDLRPRLAEIAIPATVVHGALDRLYPDSLEDAQCLARMLPDATLSVLDDAGHVPTLSRPRELAALIDALMRRCFAAGG